ncbi:biotin carboxylase N-terminal domain-containing protein [Bacteriovorax sp. Seq25_V]|uniref:ATP-binding protein n=1 Tax=Bacteriovorax sp. Seq25_V TaxID=1201288 RepID=UPI00038A46D9|nr:biotin carboxylase N-terminal domain-containing protein [Bacteriovorax sp. Seq25_V]EQC47706.1 ATP-grasp domain protein [Bacteriovorax sp. Seq25_V]
MKNVLICNRSEIALRACKSCKKLGLKSFALINDSETDTLIAEYCDKLITFNDAINPFMSLAIIERVIKQYDIHFLYPGYGFLSEDPRLAALCEELGVIFIGPKSDVLAALSSKSESFNFARRCKLKTLAVENPVRGDFPLMLKAAFGGGGRGNLICSDLDYFKESMIEIKKRSLALFDNDEILLERFLPNARHVELQVVATAKKVYFLSTRDCSVQINYQKFLEEGPSDEPSRKVMSGFYPLIERELLNLGYLGVGTIEFLWSGNELFFLEMNTRIQVEHPVTEVIFDIDLVDIQFEIALNNQVKYNFSQNGKHAICARIYAIDVEDNFSPAPSQIRFAHQPSFLRFDTHYKDGNSIGHQYDPLIGKLVVSGKDRIDCISNFKEALGLLKIGTISNNINFISAIIDDSKYLKDQLHVSFAKDFKDNYYEAELLSEKQKQLVWNRANLNTHDKLVEVGNDSGLSMFVDTNNECIYAFKKKKAFCENLSLNAPFWREEEEGHTLNYISPITGKVTKILCEVGAQVEKGETILILEAMKTELRIKAHSNGVVASLLCEEGGLVKRGQELLVI